MQDYWSEAGPPVHIMVAAAVGWKPSKRTKRLGGGPSPAPAGVERVRAVDDLSGFMQAFQGAGGTRQ